MLLHHGIVNALNCTTCEGQANGPIHKGATFRNMTYVVFTHKAFEHINIYRKSGKMYPNGVHLIIFSERGNFFVCCSHGGGFKTAIS
jgi:hypothetical protein